VDRDRIERRDFPTGRRGYDPAAVDEHLRRVADEFEASAHAPAPSMASSTSEQVRLILEAAERGAAEMRSAAGSEASDHVTRVQTAADGMLTKLDALESELTRLLTALRASGERLVDGLAELQAEASGSVVPPADERRVAPAQFERIASRDLPAAAADPTDPRGDVAPPQLEESAAAAPPHAADEPPAAPPAAADSAPGADDDLPAADALTPPAPAEPSAELDESAAAASPGAEDSPTAGADRPDVHESPPLSAPGAPDWPAPAEALFATGDEAEPDSDDEAEPDSDDESARLVALNMALNGSPRDDTRAFLAEHFSLPDLEALLDDVYARAGR
jgi:DivIVA domain-containing protein